MGDKRDIGRNAPTGSLVFEADGSDIRACEECLAWYAQVHQDDDGAIWVTEHHALDCPTYQFVLADPESQENEAAATTGS